MLSACQKEYVETEEPDRSTSITAEDNIAELIKNIVLKDGSFDNIIDKCSEVSINYPYSVTIDGKNINVETPEDIQDIVLNYFTYRDDIKINYPVTVSYSDYKQKELSGAQQLEQIKQKHNGNLKDADIECIDFVYPIEISLYDKVRHKADVVVARNDSDMHKVFKNIDDLIVELNYPIEVKTSAKRRKKIEDNEKLEVEIEEEVEKNENKDECDKIELGDEDYPHEKVLTNNKWKVLVYLDKGNECTLFSSYIFNFNEDKTIQVDINTGTETINGTWEITVQDTKKILSLEIATDKTPFDRLSKCWEIKNTSPVILHMESCSNSEGHNAKIILKTINH